MSGFTSQLTKTIEDFAESMQMRTIPTPADDGSYTFIFEQAGTFSIMASGDDSHVVLALGRKPAKPGADHMRLFLDGAGLDSLSNQPVHSGIAPNGDYYYITQIPSDRFNLPALEESLDRLCAAHDGLMI